MAKWLWIAVLIAASVACKSSKKDGKKCCCCGGNEIKNSQDINVNIFTYALTH